MSYYHSRTESNAVAYDRQERRNAVLTPVLEGLANIGSFVMFVLWLALGAAGIYLAGVLVYVIYGGIWALFGYDIFPAGFFGN